MERTDIEVERESLAEQIRERAAALARTFAVIAVADDDELRDIALWYRGDVDDLSSLVAKHEALGSFVGRGLVSAAAPVRGCPINPVVCEPKRVHARPDALDAAQEIVRVVAAEMRHERLLWAILVELSRSTNTFNVPKSAETRVRAALDACGVDVDRCQTWALSLIKQCKHERGIPALIAAPPNPDIPRPPMPRHDLVNLLLLGGVEAVDRDHELGITTDQLDAVLTGAVVDWPVVIASWSEEERRAVERWCAEAAVAASHNGTAPPAPACLLSLPVGPGRAMRIDDAVERTIGNVTVSAVVVGIPKPCWISVEIESATDSSQRTRMDQHASHWRRVYRGSNA